MAWRVRVTHSELVCTRVMFLATSANGQSDLVTALAYQLNVL